MKNSPEYAGSHLDKIGAIAIFAGILAVGATLLGRLFGTAKKSKEK